MFKIVRLKPIDKNGFCIDEQFVKRVRKNINIRDEEVVDEMLCAEIIKEFLDTFELKVTDLH